MTTKNPDGLLRVVVDGSNIATEGRSTPSLAQLHEAVVGFAEEHPGALITVVVDATFGHRIDKSEVKEFDEAVAHNELVAPPAGAIGRGDAFVLSIANKVGATILSNDSFQEFHGSYPWLFDEGRLIGGKPVPNIGWVFVNRVPVKGPVSRRARAGTAGTAGTGGSTSTSRRTASKMASLPMPVPTKPPPRPARSGRDGSVAVPPTPAPSPPLVAEAPAAATQGRATAVAVNDLLPFLEFVERHPVGTSVMGVVESYSSHGAYVTIGDLRGYVPLRLMGSPPPRSARDILRVGETATLVVANFAPGRRSVDLAVPAMAAAAETAETAGTEPAPAGRRRRSKTAPEPIAKVVDPRAAQVAEKPARRRRAAKSAAAPVETVAEATTKVTTEVAAQPARMAAKKSAAAKTAAKTAAKPANPRKAAQKAPVEKAPVEKAPAAKAPAKKAPAAEQAPAEKAPAKKAPATKKSATARPAEAVPAPRRRPAKAAAPEPPATERARARRRAKPASAEPAP